MTPRLQSGGDLERRLSEPRNLAVLCARVLLWRQEAAAVSLHGNGRRKFLAYRNREHFRKGFGSHQAHLHTPGQIH